MKSLKEMALHMKFMWSPFIRRGVDLAFAEAAEMANQQSAVSRSEETRKVKRIAGKLRSGKKITEADWNVPEP